MPRAQPPSLPGAAAEPAAEGPWTGAGARKLRCPGSQAQTIVWPPNRGFLKPPDRAIIQPGTIVDRFGGAGGRFVAPQGTSFGARSLPADFASRPLNAYEVVKPIDVDAGVSAPWFNQPGGGIQFDLPQTVHQLIESGHLRPVGR